MTQFTAVVCIDPTADSEHAAAVPTQNLKPGLFLADESGAGAGYMDPANASANELTPPDEGPVEHRPDAIDGYL